MKKEEVLKLAKEMQGEYPNWRWGQCVFNAAYELFPHDINKLRGTPQDCFFNDDLVEGFLDQL